LTPEKLKELSIIPLFFVIITLASAIVALILSYAFRLKKSQRAFATAASMFQNSNSLPIALMQSLVVTVPSLKWGPDDNKDAMLGRALTYLVVYSSLGLAVSVIDLFFLLLHGSRLIPSVPQLRWSYGVQLLSHVDDDVVHDNDNERAPLLSSNPNNPMLHRLYSAPQTTRIATRNGVLDSFPSSPVPSHSQLPSYTTTYAGGRSASPSLSETDSEMEDGRYLPSTPALPPEPPRSRLRATLASLSSFMTPPLYAALASLIVACVGPLQHFLEVHARPIKGAVNSAGACSIPITLVVLGAYFHVPREQQQQQQREEAHGRSSRGGRRSGAGAEMAPSGRASFLSLKSLREVFRRPRTSSPRRGASDDRADAGETKTVVISIVARMIITPLVLVPLMALCKMWDIQSVFDE
jgi:predicted permease